ncbi:MAG: photosystem II reaction center PsbP [Leptolyngbyaceae bacterium]|nr:photosystem II reaction center PsbP [Leptolyngbyaceae bacterium]
MLKRIVAIVLVILSFSLQSCVSAGAGLKSYIDAYNGYEFAYPNGWVEIKVPGGPDVVLHDFVDPSENVSVIIGDVPDGKTLAELGTPSEVGQKLAQRAISSDDGTRKAELISATSQEHGENTYYLLEYMVQLPEQTRHNLASVVVRRGQLFTLNISTTEQRWQRLSDQFKQVANSFSVY